MMCQIEAEEVMQEEIDLDGDQFVVAEAEQLYRDATVEVKSLSMKLVLADKAFSLVRSRMEKLVETIESLLIHIEDGEIPDEDSSSGESEDENDFVDEEREKEKLVQRAKRAEMSAEIAIRETLLAKQEAEKIKSEKQREIDDLKVRMICLCAHNIIGCFVSNWIHFTE
jgi:VIT1/CCC1 family predicted Fe2+/Mn2+ transporter